MPPPDASPWRAVRRWARRLWMASGLAFLAWQAWSMQAQGVARAVLAGDAAVVVTDSGGLLSFRPRRAVGDAAGDAAGLVFLPGALVDPRAYAPLLREVAASGRPAVLVRLPWRTAPTDAGRAVVLARLHAVLASAPTRPWVLAGHSRGAALAAQYAAERPDDLAGLVLIGTTHPKRQSLAGLQLPVTKVYGTRDCVADATTTLDNARLLPAHTRWVRLDGANHAQFGWYGWQLGDCAATMPRAEQQAGTRDAVLQALAAAAAAPAG